MEKNEILGWLKASGAVAVLRSDSTANLLEATEALADAGVRFIEFTMTIPGVLKVVEQAAERYAPKNIVIGVGSILGPENAQAAVLAGARFLVAPTYHPGVVEMAHRHGLAVIPGAYTPQEVLNAWQGGADLVKLFPATHGGPQYLRDVQEPFPQVRFITTGGNVANAADFIRAGSWAICFGGTAMGKLIANRDFDQIRENARNLLAAVRAAQS